MAIERVDNWELVIYGSDLTPEGPATGRIKIEDSHIRAALIREMGTDSPPTKPVSVGIRDRPYITIDEYIAPFYKASNNLNVMRASTRNGLKWGFTGFEWPLPVDSEIEITGLESDRRIYLRGSLYKGVLSTDDPINRYLMSRSVEHQYKQLRPLYWKDVTIDAGFAPGKQYVLDTSGAVADLVEWNPQDPRYSIAPAANIYYIIRNTIQVMWPDERVLPKDVEFRIKHDRIDVGAQPRLDHMFLPPADGITRIVEETLYFNSIADCEAIWADGSGGHCTPGLEDTIVQEGAKSAKLVIDNVGCADLIAYKDLASAVDISGFTAVGMWIGADRSDAADARIAPGAVALRLDNTAGCGSPIEEILLPEIPDIAGDKDNMAYVVLYLKTPEALDAVASVGLVDVAGNAIKGSDVGETITIYIDDIRPLPNKLTHNPMASTEVLGTPDGGAGLRISSINYATGEVVFTYTSIPTSVLMTYYALRSGGGRDIFSLREINEAYHTVRYPHKQSYVFVNKGAGTPDGTKKMDLYTLAEYHQEIPAEQRIPASVIAAARPLLV